MPFALDHAPFFPVAVIDGAVGIGDLCRCHWARVVRGSLSRALDRSLGIGDGALALDLALGPLADIAVAVGAG